MTTDWTRIVIDVRDYRYMCSVADEYLEDRSKWERISKHFDATRDEWLKREGFRNLNFEDDEERSAYSDDGIYYANRYLTIYFKNFGNSSFKENRERYVFADYYREHP